MKALPIETIERNVIDIYDLFKKIDGGKYTDKVFGRVRNNYKKFKV